MDTFEVVVPLEWPSFAYLPGTTPTGWLDADGQLTRDESAAVRFRFRTFPTMRDTAAIQRRLDEINGGVDRTVDLEMSITRNFARLRAKYEAQIWPEGRPKASNNQEALQQEAQIDAAYNADDARHTLKRMTDLRDRQRLLAEWSVLIVEPLSGWEDIVDRPMTEKVQDAIVAAYTAAKAEAEAAAGK